MVGAGSGRGFCPVDLHRRVRFSSLAPLDVCSECWGQSVICHEIVTIDWDSLELENSPRASAERFHTEKGA